ncbi:hypothetical protein [Caballeronia sp. DA-9]|uniref:hypothetical protein n=1 Tax=Caballeronia sp. DA-9 TaxID=3436237 RepID=UPI003F672152
MNACSKSCPNAARIASPGFVRQVNQAGRADCKLADTLCFELRSEGRVSIFGWL